MLTDEQVVKYVMQEFDSFKDYRQKNYDRKFIDYYKLYKSHRQDRVYSWQTNVFLPYIFSMIETVLPREIEYLYRGDRLVKAFPRERNDEESAEIVDELIRYQVDTQIDNLFLEIVEHFKQSLIYGTSISKLTWDVEKNKPRYDSLDIFDFYPQPYKKYIEEMDGCFQVYDRFVDYLFKLQSIGIGYKNIMPLYKEMQSNAGDEESKKAKNDLTGKPQLYEPKRKTALVYEYWGKVPVQYSYDVDAGYSSTKYEEMMCMVANKKHLIRLTPNPYKTSSTPEGFKPFLIAKDQPDPNYFYGIGEVEPIKDIQHEMNELECQELDNIKLIMNRMWKVSNTAGVNFETLVSYPGGVVTVNDMAGVEPLEQREIPASGRAQREYLNSVLQAATGVGDYTRGMNSPGMSDTVGGITALVEEANMRFSLKIKILQMTTISKFAEYLFKLDKIFMKSATLPIRLQGDKGRGWLDIDMDNLSGMYDFKPVGISMIGNKLARQNTIIRVLEVLAKSPPIPALAKQILDEFEFKNVDEILNQIMTNMWHLAPEGGSNVMGQNPMAPPVLNDQQAMQNLSQTLSANMR